MLRAYSRCPYLMISCLPDIFICFLQGLDTNTPMLQLGSVIFEGTYENLLGSELLLSDGPSGMDYYDPAHVALRLICSMTQGERRKPNPFGITSGRRIRFREVQLEKKKATSPSDGLQKSRHEDESRGLGDEAQPGTSTFQLDNCAP
jgi:hypothetical protein